MREREQVWKFKPFIEWASTPDGKWMQRTIFGVKNCDIYFVPGEEFEEEYFGTKLKVCETIISKSSKLKVAYFCLFKFNKSAKLTYDIQ